MVNTKKVKDRRQLHFRTGADVIADARKIVQSEQDGSLRRLGNWTVGQTFGHLATWIEYALDGYPKTVRPPWFVRVICKLQKTKFMVGPMGPGVKIPRTPGGTYGTEVIPTQQGIERLERAWSRLTKENPPRPNPLLGPLKHEEWISMNLRHAELHLGFLIPA